MAKLSVPNSFKHKLRFSPLLFGDRQIKQTCIIDDQLWVGGGGGGQVFCFLYERVDLWTFTLFISLAFREITDMFDLSSTAFQVGHDYQGLLTFTLFQGHHCAGSNLKNEVFEFCDWHVCVYIYICMHV